MANDRRDFLRASCGAAASLGITLFVSKESSAKGLFGKKRGCYCEVGEKEYANAALVRDKWNRKNFRYYIADRDNDLEKDVWDEEFKISFNSWSEVTPLSFEQVGAGKEFDLIISVGSRRRESFGRRGGVLAWAQMPPTRKFDGQLLSKFDVAENWILPDSKESGTILRSVATHEIGHLLGLSHSADQNALMYPYINNALKPMQDDIKKIQRLYGKP